MYTQQIDLFRFSRPCTKFKWKTGESFELVTNITKQQVKVSSPKCFKRIQNAQRFFFAAVCVVSEWARKLRTKKFRLSLRVDPPALGQLFIPPTPSTFTNIKGQQQQQLKKGNNIKRTTSARHKILCTPKRASLVCVCVCVHIGNSNPRPGRH